MPIFSRDPLFSGEQTETRSTTGEVLGARFDEAWDMGLVANFGLNNRLDEAEQGVPTSQFMLGKTGIDTARGPATPLLPLDDAKRRLSDAGLDGQIEVGANGIRAGALDILIDQKRTEQRRQTIMAQADGGFWQGAAGLGAAFVGSVIDPTNIALAFVPVIGEARYLQLLGRAGGIVGRTGVRAGVGAAEGFVGLAPVEAYNYYTKQRVQADYDAYDAFQSLVGGAFFGSALHAGAGMFGDTVGRALGRAPEWERSRPPVPLDAPPTVAPRPGDAGIVVPRTERAAEDAAPSVDPVAMQEARDRATVLDRLKEGRPLTREQAVAQARQNLRDELRGELLAPAGNRAEPGVVSEARGTIRGIDRELASLDEKAIARELNKAPKVTRKQAETLARKQVAERRVELAALRERAEAMITANKDASTAAERLARFDKGETFPEQQARLDAEADRLLGSTGEAPLSAGIRQALERDPFLPIRPFLARLAPETQQQALRVALAQMATGRPIDVSPVLLSDSVLANDPLAAQSAMNALRANVEAASPEADVAASRWGDERLAEGQGEDAAALKVEVDADLDALKQLMDAAGLSERWLDDALAEGSEAIDAAAAEGRGAEVAAMCLMRTG